MSKHIPIIFHMKEWKHFWHKILQRFPRQFREGCFAAQVTIGQC